jgi:hypothetical protein
VLAILEFASDEPSVPCQNGVWLGDGRHFAQGLATHSKANLTERRSLGVREPQALVQLGPQDAIFGGKVFVA